MRNLRFPNCSAVIRKIANRNIALQRKSKVYAMVCVLPAYDHFTSKFLINGDQLQPAVEIFKAAQGRQSRGGLGGFSAPRPPLPKHLSQKKY